MKIEYGNEDFKFNVSEICLTKLTYSNNIIIPFGYYNKQKYFPSLEDSYIFINDVKYEQHLLIKINLEDETITTINEIDTLDKLFNIQDKLQINYGSFNDELPEQQMAVRFLTGNEKVLEIGGNIGRNSLIIGSIVKDLVVLECDPNIFLQLKENKSLNNLNFNIENRALSNRKLIQKGWDTIPSDELLEGYDWVNTITYKELEEKYFTFDTLVLDCEGAFYWILLDFPDLLDNINLIIIENDYKDIKHKEFVDDKLITNNFKKIYFQPLLQCNMCCNDCFFEVWKK
jgi:FkbM family methyltransferase